MIRFIDGFDHYPSGNLLMKWSRRNNSTIDAMTNGTVRFPGSGQSMSLRGGTILKTLTSQTTWILGCGFRWTVVTSTGPIFIISNGTTDIASLELNGSAKLKVVAQLSSGNTTLVTGTTVVVPGVWYYIEWKFTCAASTGLISTEVRIAGVSDISVAATSGGSTTAGTTADTVGLGAPNNSFDCFFDDFYACDSSGSVNNDFLGDIRIETLYPTGAGYQSDFSHNTGSSNWSAVDELQVNNDTDYIFASTVNSIDAFAMADMTSSPPLIMGVQTVVIARKDDAGAKTFAQLTRISGANYLGATQVLYDSYYFNTRMMELSPATSTTWTATEVNGIEMGVKILS